jgi:hypothetical protein
MAFSSFHHRHLGLEQRARQHAVTPVAISINALNCRGKFFVRVLREEQESVEGNLYTTLTLLTVIKKLLQQAAEKT